MMIIKIIIILLAIVGGIFLYTHFVSAEFGYDNPTLPNIKLPPATTVSFTNTTPVNSSSYTNCWTTAEGIKCDVADITYDEISGGDVNDLGYYGYFNGLGGVVGGLSMDGDPWWLSGTDFQIDQELEVDGDTYLSDTFPRTTLTYSLGSGALRWLNLFVQNVNAEEIDAFNLHLSENLTVDGYINGVNISNLDEPNRTYTIAESGGDYTSIQSALDAHPESALFLVYPGTYVDDTISFTASKQTIKNTGKPNTAIVTNANTIVIAGDYKAVVVADMNLQINPVDTQSLATVQNGELRIRNSRLQLNATTNIAGADQPNIIQVTGTGTATSKEGEFYYYHSGDTTNGIKAMFDMDGTGDIIIKRPCATNMDNSGTALATTLFVDDGNGDILITDICESTVKDTEASIVAGLGYIGGSGDQEFHNIILNIVGGGSNNCYAIYNAGTGSIKSTYGDYDISDCANNYTFFTGVNAITESDFDNVDGSSGITGTGILKTVSSYEDGNFTVSDTITATKLFVHDITINNSDPMIKFYNQSTHTYDIGTTPSGTFAILDIGTTTQILKHDRTEGIQLTDDSNGIKMISDGNIDFTDEDLNTTGNVNANAFVGRGNLLTYPDATTKIPIGDPTQAITFFYQNMTGTTASIFGWQMRDLSNSMVSLMSSIATQWTSSKELRFTTTTGGITFFSNNGNQTFDPQAEGFSRFTENVELDGDSSGKLKFGADQDAWMYWDGTNMIFNNSGNGVYTFYNSTGLGTIRYGTALTSTTVETSEDALEDFVLGGDIVDDNGDVNHTMFGECYSVVEDTDYDNCWEVLDYVEYCTIVDTTELCQAVPTDKDVLNWTIREHYRQDCGTKLVDVVDLTCLDAKQSQALALINRNFNLYENVTDIDTDLMVENLLWQSKPIVPNFDYVSIFSDYVPFLDKHTDPAYEEKIIDGKVFELRNAEEEIINMKGYILQNEFCRKNNKKYDDYNACMDSGTGLIS